MNAPPRSGVRLPDLILAALVLTALFGLALGSLLRASPTFDEGFYIARGWAFLRTGTLLPLGHPPLTNLLSGLGVLLEPGLPDPAALDGWAALDAERVSEDLLWRQGIATTRVVTLARLPIVWLGVLLGALVYRWGREVYGPNSALLALMLTAFCPNMLAHTGLATTDLGVAAFSLASLYAWSRTLRRPSRGWLLISGILFGLAQSAKFSALWLLPALGIMGLWAALRRRSAGGGGLAGRLLRAAGQLGALTAIGAVVLWATYLFRLRVYPLDLYAAEFQHFLELAAGGHSAYLLGRFSTSGWWYYHPLALAVKTPLPALALLALAIVLAAGREMRPREWEIAFPALFYLGLTMLGTLNVGVRYLLPMIPLMYLFSARVAYGERQSGPIRAGALAIIALWHIGVSLWSYPHYLAYFNAAAGGPDHGYRVLADSNLDWGQDLPGLAAYLQQRGAAGPIYLSYFGQADPAYYGIEYVALPGWPPPPPDPDRPPFRPMNPAPGLYAISASNLVGVQSYEPDTFGYFRAREPVARIGHSIFIYEVGPDRLAASPQTRPWFAQCAAPEPSESARALRRLTGVRSLQMVYFDCTQALPFPPGPGWLLIQEGLEPVIDLGPPGYLARFPDGSPRYRVWLIEAPPPPPESSVEFPLVPLPLPIAAHVELLGYRLEPGSVPPGGELTLTGWWRVREPPPPPVSIFAHLRRPDESLLVAADGLGMPAEGWLPGMVIVQQHRFAVPPDAAVGSYTLAVGLYSLSSGERYPVAESGDRVIDGIVLRTVSIGP